LGGKESAAIHLQFLYAQIFRDLWGRGKRNATIGETNDDTYAKTGVNNGVAYFSRESSGTSPRPLGRG